MIMAEKTINHFNKREKEYNKIYTNILNYYKNY